MFKITLFKQPKYFYKSESINTTILHNCKKKSIHIFRQIMLSSSYEIYQFDCHFIFVWVFLLVYWHVYLGTFFTCWLACDTLWFLKKSLKRKPQIKRSGIPVFLAISFAHPSNRIPTTWNRRLWHVCATCGVRLLGTSIVIYWEKALTILAYTRTAMSSPMDGWLQ